MQGNTISYIRYYCLIDFSTDKFNRLQGMTTMKEKLLGVEGVWRFSKNVLFLPTFLP